MSHDPAEYSGATLAAEPSQKDGPGSLALSSGSLFLGDCLQETHKIPNAGVGGFGPSSANSPSMSTIRESPGPGTFFRPRFGGLSFTWTRFFLSTPEPNSMMCEYQAVGPATALPFLAFFFSFQEAAYFPESTGEMLRANGINSPST